MTKTITKEQTNQQTSIPSLLDMENMPSMDSLLNEKSSLRSPDASKGYGIYEEI